MTESMKAVVCNTYGEPEVLHYQDIAKPTINSDQMLVKVHATSINPIDWKIRKGMLKILTGNKFPMILGFDVSGEVVEIGSQITQFRPGDRIFASVEQVPGRAYAEYVAVSEKVACLKPQNISHEQAAAIPLAAQTALQALRDRGQIQAGSRVLINGASGGVGTFGIQIAKALGAEVTAVCSAKNAELVKSLGADKMIDYNKEDFTKSTDKYDIICDFVGNQSFWKCQNVLSQNGVYVTTLPDPGSLIPAVLTQIIPGKKAKVLLYKSNSKDLNSIKQMVEANKLRPIIARTYPLTEVAAAHKDSETGRAVGKLVITV